MAVRIGIPLPTFADAAYNSTNWPQYAAAVHDAGGEPVRLALDAKSAANQELLDACAGFLLPGSPADVDPAGYGQAPESNTAKPDPQREVLDRMVLDHAEVSGQPVLGICFGLQIMNTWRGGTLVQHLQPLPVNHAAGASVSVAHAVLVASASLLGSLLTASEAPQQGAYRRLPVNSSHHQAVALPGDGLVVTARSAQEGVIEALEGHLGNAAMLGVQWHPERSTATSAASRALFHWLVAEAADFAERAGQ